MLRLCRANEPIDCSTAAGPVTGRGGGVGRRVLVLRGCRQSEGREGGKGREGERLTREKEPLQLICTHTRFVNYNNPARP